MEKSKVIGITGGIGSGKSYLANLLASHMGIPVYGCDERAKELTSQSPVAQEKLARLAGREVLTGQGIDKQVLAQFLFSDRAHAAQVEAIIHPLVKADFLLWKAQQDASLVALESAILYQSHFHLLADYVLVVEAPLETRIRRAMQRDHATRESIEQRVLSQNPVPAGMVPDYVISNGEGKEDDALLKELALIIRNIK